MQLSLLNEHIVVIDVFVDFIYIDYTDENGYAGDWEILKKISEKVTYWSTYKSLQATNSDAVLFCCSTVFSLVIELYTRVVYKGYNAYS